MVKLQEQTAHGNVPEYVITYQLFNLRKVYDSKKTEQAG